MESRRKRSRSQILKWCCYVLGLFVCAALQTTPGLFQLGQAKPLLLLPHAPYDDETIYIHGHELFRLQPSVSPSLPHLPHEELFTIGRNRSGNSR